MNQSALPLVLALDSWLLALSTSTCHPDEGGISSDAVGSLVLALDS